MTDDAPLDTPHAFKTGNPAIWGSKCRLCGKLPTNEIHAAGSSPHPFEPRERVDPDELPLCVVCGKAYINRLHHEQSESTPREYAASSPHPFAPHPNGESRLCATCGKPYNSNVHHEDDVSVSMSVEHAAMTWAVARRHRVAAAEALAAVNVAPGHPDNSSELEAWKAWERLELQLSDQLYQVCCAAVAGGRQ